MKFFAIPPLSDLPLMHQGSAGYFLLAHLYVSDEKYRDFVHNKIPESSHVIMDNGAAENSLVTEDVLIDIVKEVKPTEVIAPDVLFDKHKTITNATSFIHRMIEEGLDQHTDIFFCPQGESLLDWLAAYKFGMDNPDVATIGMSKIAVPYAFSGAKDDTQISESRHLAVDMLLKLNWLRKPLHFLGMGDPREFQYYLRDLNLTDAQKQLIRSTDSCYSILAGMNGINFREGDFERIPTPHDYFESVAEPECHSDVLSNLRWMREYVG